MLFAWQQLRLGGLAVCYPRSCHLALHARSPLTLAVCLLLGPATTHLDQQRQCPALHDLPLVVVVLEGQRPQGACCCALHLQVPAVEQPHQGGDAAVRPHLHTAIAPQNLSPPALLAAAIAYEGAGRHPGNPVQQGGVLASGCPFTCTVPPEAGGTRAAPGVNCRRRPMGSTRAPCCCRRLTMFLISMFS